VKDRCEHAGKNLEQKKNQSLFKKRSKGILQVLGLFLVILPISGKLDSLFFVFCDSRSRILYQQLLCEKWPPNEAGPRFCENQD
jgi:hypothetical protein